MFIKFFFQTHFNCILKALKNVSQFYYAINFMYHDEYAKYSRICMVNYLPVVLKLHLGLTKNAAAAWQKVLMAAELAWLGGI